MTMGKRKGDLRLLKSGVVFGPTDREGLDKLLAAGRIGPDDSVSVCNTDWMSIREFLAQTAPSPPAPQPDLAPPAELPKRAKRGELRIIHEGRLISSLSQEDIAGLLDAGRISRDDLVSFEHGPWMRIGDFLSPRPLRAASANSTLSPAATPLPVATRLPVATPVAMPFPAARIVACPTSTPAQVGERDPRIRSGDDWFVRVRGVHSAPLKLHHLKALYQAKEVTLENHARHPAWADNDWRPIRLIPELSDIVCK